MKRIHSSEEGRGEQSRNSDQSVDLQQPISNSGLLEGDPYFHVLHNVDSSDTFLRHSTSWLEEDLNLQSFENSIFEPLSFEDPEFQFPNGTISLQNDYDVLLEDEFQTQWLAYDTVRKAWFTYVDESNNSGNLDNESQLVEVSSDVSDTYDLGETFRERASRRLSTQPNLDPLPSTMYLVSSR